MRKPWRWTAYLLFVGALIFAAVAGDRLLAMNDETRSYLGRYTELLEVAKANYGEDISYRDLVYATIQGMLRSLDPHTSFLTPESYESMRDRQQGSFYGLGILVGVRDGKLTVITPISGSPADRLGMRAGDIISLIEGEPTETMTLDEAVSKLKGPKDTQVTITVDRRGLDEPLELSITRAPVSQETVQYKYMLDDQTGYLMIRDFARTTGREVADALGALREQGMKRLILDLRGNGGGLLDQAIEVADQFVPAETLIVETRGRARNSDSAYFASDQYAELGLPLIVLVNGGSASASEIVSGTIQDHDVGLIVGEPTWGKGLVQTVYTLPYGAGMALTTAQYYTPAGRLIQRDYTSYWDYYTQWGEPPETDSDTDVENPVFHTDLGRAVYGGGGITPDVISEPGFYPPFVQFLRARAAFLNFAVDYMQGREFEPDWRPTDETLERFEAWLQRESISSPEEIEEGLAEEQAPEEIATQIRYEIFNAKFGVTNGNRVLAERDTQLQKAMTLFDEAADLLKRRQALQETPGESSQRVAHVAAE